MPVMGEQVIVPEQDIHPAFERSHPHIAVAVPVGGMDGVITQAGAIYIIVGIVIKLPVNRIKDVQSSILHADPDIPAVVFTQGIDHVA